MTLPLSKNLHMTPELQMRSLIDVKSKRMPHTSLCPAVGIVLIQALGEGQGWMAGLYL